MIEREIQTESTATPSVLNPVYKMMVILLLLLKNKSEKGAKISRIQVYLWGMSGRKNRQILANYKDSGQVGELPITPDRHLRVILADAEQKGLIESVKDGPNSVRYKITPQGGVVLMQLTNTNIYGEIEDGLNEIGYLPDNKIDNINYVWTYDVF